MSTEEIVTNGYGSTEFSWFIPIDGDGTRAGTSRAERPPDFDYLRKVVQIAEDEGYYSLLIPTRFANGLFAEDAPLAETWTTATALAAVTERIRFLIAVRPGFVALGLFAQMAAALHQISKGRIDINIVPGGIQNDFERVGEVSDQSTRYERAEEFIAACRKLWSVPGPVEFNGDFYKLRDAFCSPIPEGQPPRFYLGGASPRANALSGRQADVHLNWIEPIEDSSARFDAVRAEFEKSGRTPHLGIRTHLVVRDREEDAWRAANELIDHADPAVKAQRKASVAGTPMVGAAAQVEEAPNHIVAPNLWNGLSEVRVNCGTAIVGTPEQVTDILMDYWKLGVEQFILSGFPHVEECQRVATDVLPLLREKMAAS
ncbi:MAG TPA: hypothetical protein DHW65_04735 [Dehalococcoidia bacterium]|nr:hypothetical protein [Chloroflexota bacterium]HCL25637.1 hypothetical protein [Dehalococcoidia bacterium]